MNIFSLVYFLSLHCFFYFPGEFLFDLRIIWNILVSFLAPGLLLSFCY